MKRIGLFTWEGALAIFAALLFAFGMSVLMRHFAQNELDKPARYWQVAKEARKNIGFEYRTYDLDSGHFSNYRHTTKMVVTRITSESGDSQDERHIHIGDTLFYTLEDKLIREVLNSRGKTLTLTVMRKGKGITVAQPSAHSPVRSALRG